MLTVGFLRMQLIFGDVNSSIEKLVLLLLIRIANFTPSFPEICREAPNALRIKIIDQSKSTAKKTKTNTLPRVVSLVKINYLVISSIWTTGK